MNGNPRYRKLSVGYCVNSQRSDKSQRGLPSRQSSADLTELAQDISPGEIVNVESLSEPTWTTGQLAERLSVCPRTISRWRRLGLPCRKVRFLDGRVRAAFTEQCVRQFARQNSALVRRGREFTRLTPAEKRTILQRARDLVQQGHARPHAVSRQIAAETGRSVETVRYTLRRHDRQNPTRSIFAHGGRPDPAEPHAALQGRLAHGESLEQIADTLKCSVDHVRQILRDAKVRSLIEAPPKYVYDALFDAPDADALILAAPQAPGATDAKNHQALTDPAERLGTSCEAPVLTREQEVDLFRRYNYLKFKLAGMAGRLKPETASETEVNEILALMNHANEVRDRLIRCNLRLVGDIVKRFSGKGSAVYDLLSDGNMALMRAVESFDYARGNKLSSYATTAIVRTLMRTLGTSSRRAGQWITDSNDRLQLVPDGGEPPESAVLAAERRRLLHEGLRQLDERERVVIGRRFGLGNNGWPETLASIARDYGVTKECIRQVEERALQRLRLILGATVATDLLDAA